MSQPKGSITVEIDEIELKTCKMGAEWLRDTRLHEAGFDLTKPYKFKHRLDEVGNIETHVYTQEID